MASSTADDRSAAIDPPPGAPVASVANGNQDAAATAPLEGPASALLAPPMAESAPTYDQIAEAAYLRYLNRGGTDGRDFDDWVEAEQELKTR